VASSLLLLVGLVVGAALAAQQLPWQTGQSGQSGNPDAAKEPVRYEAPAQIELTHGKPQIVELHFRIQDGLHINSHMPSDKSFIRTELIVIEPPGINVQDVSFPPGTEFASAAFPKEKLNVYTGEVVLHARILAVKPGEQMLNAALHYQACDASTCFPPKNAPVAIDLIAR